MSEVKKTGVEYDYTPEEIKELVKCKKDIFYFLKYVKIVHPDKGLVVFEPWDYQIDLLSLILNNRFSISLVARQQGKSILVSTYLLWYSIFNKNKTCGVVSNNEAGAIDILDRIKIIYEELPDFLKPGIVEYNKKTITFENGSKVMAKATSSDSFRGRTLNICVCDEFAFVDPPWKADEFFTSNWPTISASKKSKFIIISTARGIGNIFHKIYTEAESGANTFKHFFADWRAHPDRDEEWAAEQRKNLGERRFKQEFECSFLGSGSTLINEESLRRLLNQPNIEPTGLLKNGKFRVYESPVNGTSYITAVDVSKGTGGDYSVIQVLKIISSNPVKLKQVAVFEDNTIDVYNFSSVVNDISVYYNNAYAMIENNAEGNTVVSEVWWKYEYDNLISEGTKASSLGIRATVKTKPKAAMLLKKMIEDESIELVDYRTIQQLLTFNDLGNNKFGAATGQHDDLVTSLYWGTYFFTFDILNEEVKLFEKKDEDDCWYVLHDNDVMDDQMDDF